MSTRVLIAAAGMVYTDGEVYGKEIWLGVNDDPKNWNEVPVSEIPSDADEDATEADYIAALAKLGVQ